MGNENLGGTPHVLLFIIPGVTSFMVMILHVHTYVFGSSLMRGLGFETKLLIRVFSSLMQVMVPVYFWEGMN